MADYFFELLNRETLISGGVSFIFLGSLLLAYRRIAKGVFAARSIYAQKLRMDGKMAKAEALDAETATFTRRVSIYGAVFVALGLVSSVCGLLTSR